MRGNEERNEGRKKEERRVERNREEEEEALYTVMHRREPQLVSYPIPYYGLE